MTTGFPRVNEAELLCSLTAKQIARFWANIEKTDTCWLWRGNLAAGGYGAFYYKNKTMRAHRVALFLTHGAISPDLMADHLCRVRACCNPAHIELVTNRMNILRGTGPSAQNANKTRCKRGHELDKRRTNGQRVCSICERAQWARNNAKRALRAILAKMAIDDRGVITFGGGHG